jgi:hypothetical protein
MSSNTPALLGPRPAGATNLVEADIRQAKPPVEVPNDWAWLGWALLAAALIGLAYWAWRRWRRKRTGPAPEIVIPPHVRARDKLRSALELIHQPEPFCVLVSDTIRVYLEECFDLRAPERTTEEFLEELQESALLALNQKRSLADFLVRCDLVKFARYEPGEPELRDLYDAAMRLIDETESMPTVAAVAAQADAPPAPVSDSP